MSFTQQTVFGASIVGWNSSLGLGGEVSRLDITLVEDPKNGDSFTEPPMGLPLFFTYEGFTFNGVVIGWSEKSGEQGNPIYEVTVIDPREFLNGVQIILSDYYGSTSAVPNLINAYGWLESLGFGVSQINDGGIPWRNVRTAISDAVLSVSSYGRPLNFFGYEYIVDLTGLPSSLPSYYRIGGNNISLLDFIQEVCDAASYDYFIDMYQLNGTRVIRANTISRSYVPVLGSIRRFVSNVNGAVAKEIGYEARNEPCSKFVVGGQQRNMFAQLSYEIAPLNKIIHNPATEANTDILPFWGFDESGKPIIGMIAEPTTISGNTRPANIDDYTVSVDSRRLLIPGVGSTYTFDLAELRSAMVGEEAWRDFLWSRVDQEFRRGYPSLSNNRRIPQYQRARILNVIGYNYSDLASVINTAASVDDMKNLSMLQFAGLTHDVVNASSLISDASEESVSTVYQFVKNYATEFFGKKWMVRIPFVFVAEDSETGTVRLSQEPTESGFIDESEYSSAVANGLLPWDHDKFNDGDGRFIPYVRFDNAENLDFSNINQDDMVVTKRRYFDITLSPPRFVETTSVFVKCAVDPNVIFLDPVNKLNPVVIVTLPSAVYEKPSDVTNYYYGIIKSIVDDKVLTPAANGGLEGTSADVDDILQKWMTQPGSDFLFAAKGNLPALPALFAVPLMSNILTYGPWYAIGDNGPVEYEFDDSLVPWNYGGYSAMNLVGQSKVSQALLTQQTAEYGRITIPGAPQHSLGNALIFGGPYITSVSTSISEQGVTTDYSMATWTPQFGKLSKARADRAIKLNLRNRDLRRAFRQFIKNRPPKKPSEKAILEQYVAYFKKRRKG